MKNILISYFITPFKSNQYYNFSHNSNLNLNEVFVYVSQIFKEPETLFEQSIHISNHLYSCSIHPKIKNGEFYIVYFKDCLFEGNTVNAIGLFKSENKDIFLKVKSSPETFILESNQGININKLDKGCLIFNCKETNELVVSVVDGISKGGEEAAYWNNNFLNIVPRHDNYYNTQSIMALCKNFITKELPNHYNTPKSEQVSLLNKSLDYFKEKDYFDFEEFSNEVIGSPALIEKFNDFKINKNNDISDNFSISNNALKKQAKAFKKVIKLDKNFDILVHKNQNLIEKGVEPSTGRKFYKIYYEEEL